MKRKKERAKDIYTYFFKKPKQNFPQNRKGLLKSPPLSGTSASKSGLRFKKGAAAAHKRKHSVVFTLGVYPLIPTRRNKTKT